MSLRIEPTFLTYAHFLNGDFELCPQLNELERHIDEQFRLAGCDVHAIKRILRKCADEYKAWTHNHGRLLSPEFWLKCDTEPYGKPKCLGRLFAGEELNNVAWIVLEGESYKTRIIFPNLEPQLEGTPTYAPDNC